MSRGPFSLLLLSPKSRIITIIRLPRFLFQVILDKDYGAACVKWMCIWTVRRKLGNVSQKRGSCEGRDPPQSWRRGSHNWLNNSRPMMIRMVQVSFFYFYLWVEGGYVFILSFTYHLMATNGQTLWVFLENLKRSQKISKNFYIFLHIVTYF